MGPGYFRLLELTWFESILMEMEIIFANAIGRLNLNKTLKHLQQPKNISHTNYIMLNFFANHLIYCNTFTLSLVFKNFLFYKCNIIYLLFRPHLFTKAVVNPDGT